MTSLLVLLRRRLGVLAMWLFKAVVNVIAMSVLREPKIKPLGREQGGQETVVLQPGGPK
jgi:hypothetical protein